MRLESHVVGLTIILSLLLSTSKAQSIPAIPQNLSAVKNASYYYELSWSDLADNETQYQVDRRAHNETDYSPLVLLPANSNSYLDLNSFSPNEYYYRVRALGLDGNSDYTYVNSIPAVNVICGQAYCYPENCSIGYPPTEWYTRTIKAECIDCVLSITFERFETELGRDQLFVYDGNSTKAPLLGKFSGSSLPPTLYSSGSILTLQFTTDYSMQTGEGWKFTTSCLDRPIRPQITGHKELYSSEVTLNWIDNSPNESGYKIDKSTSPFFASVTTYTLPANSSEFYFDKLDSAQTYYFRVRSFTNHIESYNSPVYTRTTPGAPFIKILQLPVNLEVNNQSDSWVRMCDFNNDRQCDYLTMIPDGVSDYKIKLYLNNGDGTFNLSINQNVDPFSKEVQLLDIDQDMDMDLLFQAGRDIFSLINHGSSFERKSVLKSPLFFTENFGMLSNDYDQDGDEDLFLYDKLSPFATWFKNNRNGEFSFDSLSLLKKQFSDVKLVDIDNNGRVDLMTTEVGLGRNRFYINQGYRFEFINYSMPYQANLLPVDLNNDNDIDFITRNGNSTYFFINNGSTTFVDEGGISNLSNYDQGAPIDLDNDGDLDFVFNSSALGSGGNILLNKGNNKFAFITNFGFQSYAAELIDVIDFDGDNNPDVIIYDGHSDRIVVWKNVMSLSTNNPTKPEQLVAITGNGSATLTWHQATDDITPSTALRYNYYIGKTPSGQEIKSLSSFHTNEWYFHPYPQGSNRAVINNIEKGTYHWGVQSVDGALLSSISSTSTFEITESNYIRPPRGLSFEKWSPHQINISWIDDSDNEEGFLVLRSSSMYSGYKVVATVSANQTTFKDTGLDQFTVYCYRVVAFKGDHHSDPSSIEFVQTLPFLSDNTNRLKTTPTAKIALGEIQWVDLNNDNRKDFIWAGKTGDFYAFPGTYVFQSYAQSPTSPWQFDELSLKFTGASPNEKNVPNTKVQSGDFDNDGDIDLLYGRVFYDLSPYYYQLVIMQNTGSLTFEPIVLDNKVTSAEWGDYDNDGDLDVLASASNLTCIYKNNGDKNFSKVFSLPYGFHAKWFDANNDGWLDIATIAGGAPTKLYIHLNKGIDFVLDQSFECGDRNFYICDFDNDNDEDIFISSLLGASNPNFSYLRNNFTESKFEIVQTTLSKTNGDIVWMDFDNDYHLDLLKQRIGDASVELYRGSGSPQLTLQQTFDAPGNVIYSVNDIDGDSDMDLFCTGYGTKFQVMENNSKEIKSKPNPPVNLTSKISGDTLILEWTKVSDSVTYNVMVGTSPDKMDVLNPLTDFQTGFRKINSIGNARYSSKKIIKGLKDGVYFWNVQSVDDNFQGSVFSKGESIIIGTSSIETPASFNAFAVSSRTIKLTFNETPLNTLRMIYYSIDGVQYTLFKITSDIEVLHSGLDPDHNYHYRFVLTDNTRYSPYSPVATAKTLPRPTITDSNFLLVEKGESFSIPLSSLEVINSPGYPNGYSLLISPSDYYSVSENLITPSIEVTDTLYVPIRIASVADTSDVYYMPFKINVVTDTEVDDSQQNWVVYPNPTTDILNVYNKRYKGQFKVIVLDNFGKVFYSSTIDTKGELTDFSINLKTFPSSLYTVLIIQEKIWSFKVIKH